ncbi:MAG: SMP-30/gluconolactonase/LRE family protein [Candidatus Anaerobiospirillum merdipullorum]|uniref:SMP-30/gluconolactonase/LRE family protein n=1 Tax=Candidatus Anaerobiospirillum merdipullorum TaxID=2838450 RepID=A0A9E2KQ21_9GAMM|nr:SMP-30/gluconolactonase/LRE family protein [Candidatus Anaerobiospirillum merdipullorum]
MISSSLITAPFKAVAQLKALLGETPIYDEIQDVFYCVDIKGSALWICDPYTLNARSLKVPTLTSAALLTNDPQQLLLVSQSGLFLLNLKDESLRLFYPFSFTQVRPNEAQIAPDGVLWFSTMGLQAQAHAGAMFRFDPQLHNFSLVQADITIPNTLIFNEGQTTFFDTASGDVFNCDLNGQGLVKIPSCLNGTPDGSCLTDDGLILNANWGASELRLFAVHNGYTLKASLPVPARQPSSCALGGRDLNLLFVTTAIDGLAKPNFLDGQAFVAPSSLKGRLNYRFTLI